MWWNVRFRGSGFSLLSYVRGGPYPKQDVMPAQAWVLLFGQILSLLISITYKTSLMVSQNVSVPLERMCCLDRSNVVVIQKAAQDPSFQTCLCMMLPLCFVLLWHTHCHWVFHVLPYVWSFYCILSVFYAFASWKVLNKYSYSFTYSLPSLCRFPIPHWHYPCEKRSRLPGQGSCGTSLQVTRQLIHTGKTRPWVSAADNFLGSDQ